MNMNDIGQLVSISMFFYVLTKFIFNTFAEIQIPMDTWSSVDIFCAFTNISCFTLLSLFMKPENIINEDKKLYFNLLMLMVVLATWSRIIAICLVIPSFSKLIMTIYAMLGSAGTFIFIVLYYLVIVTMIAYALYQEAVADYQEPFYIFRKLFDALMGNYGYDNILDNHTDKSKEHTVFLFFHIYIANVFLLNYLVAILSTVYGESMEIGEFSYNCNKYLYIERYNIAFQDKNGYSELVLYPPPVNMMLIFLLPGVF